MSEWTRVAQPVRCKVELDKQLTVRRERGVLAQGDANANAIVAEVYQTDGQPYDLTGCTALLTFVRPDNLALPPIAAEISGNTATATLPDACYEVTGTYETTMQLRKGGDERTILWLIGDVKGKDIDGIVDPDHAIISIEDLMATAAEAQKAANAANTAAARANAGAERAEQLQIDASGLAGDSNKLGSKPPEYYLPAVNLLDNSRFEIAQAGYGGFHGSTLYAADRWQANNDDGTTYQKTSEGLTVTSSAAYEGQIMQVVADSAALVGKTLTYAVKARSEFGRLGMLAYCYDANENIVQNNLIERVFSELAVRAITFTVPANTAKIRCYINNRAADTYTVEWAALYEGSYTDDTLPPYVPRPYAVELLECQRYCIAYETNSTYETVLATGYTDSSFARFSIDLAVPMRIENPTISADSGIVFGVRSNGSYKQAGSVTIQKALGKKLYLQANGAFESGHVACLVYYTDVDTKKRIIISADL